MSKLSSIRLLISKSFSKKRLLMIKRIRKFVRIFNLMSFTMIRLLMSSLS